MSKSNETRMPVRVVVTVMLLAPVLAWPVVATLDGGPHDTAPVTPSAAIAVSPAEPAVQTAPVVRSGSAMPATVWAATAAPKTGSYQIRCWQHGRLLFEENHVGLPDTARYALRISGTDTHGRPLYVADTQHATCLIRRAVDDRAWPR